MFTDPKQAVCNVSFMDTSTKNIAPANLQKCVGGFLLYKFWRIFSGIFLEDFSGHFFPQKRGEKIRRENPRKNPAAQK